jgi:ACS family hexuronate transporter-like MFS transporter
LGAEWYASTADHLEEDEKIKHGAHRHERPQFKIGGLRWWIAGLLFLATLISYLDRMTLSILAPTICSDLHLSNLQYAGISVWFLFAYSIGQSFFGKLQDRIGTKRGLALAMTIWSVAETLQGLTRGLFSLSALRALLGLGEGGHWPAAIKGVAEWFPQEQRGVGVGIVNTGATLGSALAPPLIVLLEVKFGWRTTFLVTVMFGFAWLVAWLLAYQVPRKHPWLKPEELILIERGSTVGASQGSSWRELLKERSVRGIVFSRMLGDPVWWLYLIWLPLYLARARGLSLPAIGAFAWIPFLCADAGALLGGWVSGRLIRQGWTARKARGAAILFAAALSPVGVFVAGARTAGAAIFFISIELFAFQFWINNVQTIPSDLFPSEQIASISGLAGTGAGIGAILFVFSTGWIVDHYGYSPVLTISALLIPAATAVLSWLVREVPRDVNTHRTTEVLTAS